MATDRARSPLRGRCPDEAHRQVERAILDAGGVDGHDVRVLGRCGGVGFGDEPVAERRIRRQLGSHHLQGYLAVGVLLAREVHDPHTAASDLAQDVEACDRPPHDRFVP
jgi:hypothetical protein